MARAFVIALASAAAATATLASASAQASTPRGDAIRWTAAHLKPCKTEDSRNCQWDARTMGNGYGRSFINLNGNVYRYGPRY